MTAAQRVDVGGGNDLWHYAVGSERKGPVPRTTIAKLLASGEISAETYVWQPGMDNWVHLVDAPPLKALVAGLEGDGHPEEFVEEDTAFTSPADLKAVHIALDSDDDEEELSGDTIVEAIPVAQPAKSGTPGGPHGTVRTGKNQKGGNTIMGTPAAAQAAAQVEAKAAAAARAEPAKAAAPASAKATPTGSMAAQPAPSASPTLAKAAVSPAAAVAGKPAVAPAAAVKPAAKADSGLFSNVASSTTGSAAASGADLFASGGDDDIFGGSEPTSEAEDIAGVHGRRQSSVLFSLDELGREEGKKGGGGRSPGGNEQFVTDSSGLIDIKAIATNERKSADHDPFGASAPNLVLAPRNSPAAMTVPIVERRRGNGPWILAAAALLLIGGGIVAFILSSGKTPTPVAPPVVAAAEPPKNEPATKAEPLKTEPVKDPAANSGQPATPNPTEVAKVEPVNPTTNTDPANPGTNAAGTNPVGTNPVVANPVVAKPVVANPVVAKDDRPKTEVKKDDKPKTEVKKDDKPKEPVVVVAPPTKADPANTNKVNDLLNKLNSGDKTDTTAPGPTDSAVPDKLSAATVRNTIKGRFGRCGGMISNPSGSVTVQTQFVISSSGVVQSARVSDGGGTSPDVQRCVVSVIKETNFGKFKEPTMQVNLPVRLL